MGELINLVKEYRRTHEPAVGDNIVRMISPSLQLFISLRVSKENVDDILQDTLVGIFLKIDRFKGGSDAQFHGYCYTIAHRRVIDEWRRRGREPEFVFPENEFWEAIAQPQPPLTKRQREQLESVMDLFAAVRPPCILYLVARYIVGMTFAEMRQAFDFPSAAAARMATGRCLRLAKELGEE